MSDNQQTSNPKRCGRAGVRQAPAEYRVECLSPWAGLWYFVSRVHGLTRAVELAAVMREIKGHPTRVVRIS